MNDLIVPDFGQVLTRDPSTAAKEMLRVEQRADKTVVWINSSSLSVIQTCPRKSYYLLERKLRSKVESPALVFGQAIHRALEVFYSLPTAKRELPENFADNASLIVQGFTVNDDHPFYKAIAAFREAGSSLQALPDTDKRSLSAGAWLLTHYFKTYLHDEFVVYHDARGPVTERTFSLELMHRGDLEIHLFGTIDLVLKNQITGELLPCDHKTSSTMGSDFLNRIKPNHQYTGYLIGAQQVLGLDVEKFLVNGIQVKPKPLTARGTPPTFTRQITVRNATDIAEFKDVVLESVQNYLRWKSNNVWPLGSVDACANWGGCQYLQVCSAPTALRENIIEGVFHG
jgi:PD-(D/E)XK nuclease superfamily protein